MQAPCRALAEELLHMKASSCAQQALLCGQPRSLRLSRCWNRSSAMVSFSSLASRSSADEFKESNSSLLTERLSSNHEEEVLNSPGLKNQSTIFSSIDKDIDKLEHVLSKEEIYVNDSSMSATWEVQSKCNNLEEEIFRMQALLDLKEQRLKDSFEAAILLRTHLQDAEAQASSLRLFKKSHDTKQAEVLSKLERLSLESLEILDKHFIAHEAMSRSIEELGKVRESILQMHNFSSPSKVIDILQREASFYFQSLILSTEALAKAEGEFLLLSQKFSNTEVLLEKERKSLKATRDGLEELERALSSEESKVDDLFKEVSSLKAQLEQKERMVQNLTNESLKNKGLQELARKHLNAFHQSERKVQQLMTQCNAVQNEIKSKNLLLENMRKEAYDKTEALRLAAQIKQELNLCRHHEVQLTQELERERLQAKELSREVMENNRAVKAELALRQAKKNMMDLNRELGLLQKGIESRDGIIKVMQEKIDGNVQILQNAMKDREAVRMMKARIHSLELQLREFL